MKINNVDSSSVAQNTPLDSFEIPSQEKHQSPEENLKTRSTSRRMRQETMSVNFQILPTKEEKIRLIQEKLGSTLTQEEKLAIIRMIQEDASLDYKTVFTLLLASRDEGKMLSSSEIAKIIETFASFDPNWIGLAGSDDFWAYAYSFTFGKEKVFQDYSWKDNFNAAFVFKKVQKQKASGELTSIDFVRSLLHAQCLDGATLDANEEFWKKLHQIRFGEEKIIPSLPWSENFDIAYQTEAFQRSFNGKNLLDVCYRFPKNSKLQLRGLMLTITELAIAVQSLRYLSHFEVSGCGRQDPDTRDYDAVGKEVLEALSDCRYLTFLEAKHVDMYGYGHIADQLINNIKKKCPDLKHLLIT